MRLFVEVNSFSKLLHLESKDLCKVEVKIWKRSDFLWPLTLKHGKSQHFSLKSSWKLRWQRYNPSFLLFTKKDKGEPINKKYQCQRVLTKINLQGKEPYRVVWGWKTAIWPVFEKILKGLKGNPVQIGSGPAAVTPALTTQVRAIFLGYYRPLLRVNRSGKAAERKGKPEDLLISYKIVLQPARTGCDLSWKNSLLHFHVRCYTSKGHNLRFFAGPEHQ